MIRKLFEKRFLELSNQHNFVHNGSVKSYKVCHIDRKYITPYYESCHKPTSLVSLSFVKNNVCYMEMNSSFNIISWSSLNLFENIHPKRSDHFHFQSELWKTVQKLPKSELYLIEYIVQPAPSSSIISSVLHKTYTEAVFLTLLNHPAINLKNKLYKLKSLHLSQFFGVLLGGQRLECSPIVKSILERNHELSDVIQIPFSLGNNFLSREKLLQEHMTYCFLQCVFFYKNLLYR